jgi:hypothetical protein
MSIPDVFYTVKFAEYIELIKILYLVDDNFKAICEEYHESKVKSLKFKEKFEKDYTSNRKYENLSQELEEELLIYLLKKR